MSYKIITDSCCDLTEQMARELEIHIAPLGVDREGEFFEDRTMPAREFYAGMREGKVSTTSAVNPQGWTKVMEPILSGGEDVLVLAFSSGLSTTYQSAVIAAEEMQDKYPGQKVLVADTLCASVGQGLIIWYASQLRREGRSMEDVYQWVLDNRLKVAHWVSVEDLKYLKRGGRISATTAVVGTMLSIKPLIHVNDEGKLDSVAKARGRKASLNALCQKVEQSALPEGLERVFIGHADCLEDVQYMAQQCREKYGVKEVVLSDIGSVIGSHVGPGGIVLCFLASHR